MEGVGLDLRGEWDLRPLFLLGVGRDLRPLFLRVVGAPFPL